MCILHYSVELSIFHILTFFELNKFVSNFGQKLGLIHNIEAHCIQCT